MNPGPTWTPEIQDLKGIVPDQDVRISRNRSATSGWVRTARGTVTAIGENPTARFHRCRDEAAMAAHV